MAMDNFQFNWAAPRNTQEYMQTEARINANKTRIAQLEQELQILEGQQSQSLTDMDMLDLELAANRANAYDMGNTTAALGRIDSRMSNRERSALEKQKSDYMKQQEKELKIADLEDKLRQNQVNRAKATLDSERAVLDSQAENLGKQLEAAGGKYVPMEYGGKDAQRVLSDYFRYTTNTQTGRKFNDDVDAELRANLVQDLLDIGQYEKAMEIEKTLTKAEKDEAKKKSQEKKASVKAKIEAVKTVLNNTQGASTPEQQALRVKAKHEADSLARNFPDLVELKNGYPIFKAKD